MELDVVQRSGDAVDEWRKSQSQHLCDAAAASVSIYFTVNSRKCVG